MTEQEKVINNLADELKDFGGYLECKYCGKKKPLGDIGKYLSSGWEECCGYTMTWITKNRDER